MSRRRRASTQEEEAPQFDVRRFTSIENAQWYEARAHKQLIVEKHLEDNVEQFFQVEEQFARLGWEPILTLPERIYPNLVREFYANILNKEQHSGSFLDTTVRGIRIYLTRRDIARILNCRNLGYDVDMKKEFRWDEETWSLMDAKDRFHVRDEATRQGEQERPSLLAKRFQPLHHIIIYLFAHNVIPKRSGKNEVRNSDVYLLDKMIYGQGNDLNKIPLPSIIISYMNTVARTRVPETSFGFPRLLTRIFQHFRIALDEAEGQPIPRGAIIKPSLLRRLHMNPAIVDQIPGAREASHEQQEEQEETEIEQEESSLQAGPSTSTRAPRHTRPSMQTILDAFDEFREEQRGHMQSIDQKLDTMDARLQYLERSWKEQHDPSTGH